MGALPPFKIEMEGLNTLAPATLSYPDSPDLLNVRWDEMGNLLKRTGYVAYCDTAQPDKSGGGAYDCEQVTGIFDFKKRDTTTRYTIVCTPTRIMVAPTTGAWTVLKSGISGPTATDYWDAAVFNNQLILTCPGALNPIITGGTAATTYDLTGGAVWQAVSNMNNSRYANGRLAATPSGIVCSDGYTGTVYAPCEIYDPIANAWSTVTSTPTPKNGSAVTYLPGYEKVYTGPGDDSAGTRTSLSEYSPDMDAWLTKKSATSARIFSSAFTVNNRHYAVSGDNGSGAVTTCEAYDPATDTWTTMSTAVTVAKKSGAGFEVAELGYITGGNDNTSTIYNTTYRYNPIADTYTAVDTLNTARDRIQGAGAGQSDRGLGYVTGGTTTYNDWTTESNVMEYYDPIANTWTAGTVLTDARGDVASGISDYWLYCVGGTQTGAAGLATGYRYNISYSAPQAHYVENYAGYLFMARTASAPSRVFYSLPGDSAVWNPDAYFDVNADDGDWITGMFVFQGRLYVSKIGTLYQVYGTDFDPEVGDYGIQELPNIPGTVSDRSIVVTDHGVYYLAKDGFRLFDGAGSRVISTKINPTIEGYVQSRNKAVQGVWNRKKSEIWWTMTSTGSTHDTIIVYNHAFDRWTKFTGMTASSLMIVEDANDNPQILFGPASTTDGYIYKADSGETDNTGAINAYYKTGWFTVTSQIRDYAPRYVWIWVKRSGAWNLTVEYFINHGTTATNTDTINLLSGTYPDSYFFDGTDQRARINVGSEENSHATQLKFSNASASQPFEVYASVIECDEVVGDTYAP